ncbi:hypothetical protein Thiowin_04096 [Thiorhodovibrio winogradskyi]|uniref:Class I SAM-dependent methyltransferase n=1 Tax=Thiorhodovibrio winogradskyi TaxID=77007 RepID=A0ABZ0SDL8_9GAMM|nr:class I SAM-dependent methyltransferase [Thiorhodovibrio winogradskyi]
MSSTSQILLESTLQSSNRLEFWKTFVKQFEIESILEVGVFRGQFAEQMLLAENKIKSYWMVDPWRHLDDWNKPANKENEVFEKFYLETLRRTEFAEGKRIVLRGKTTEVVEQLPDGKIDLAYIDGDHTLRGITIDLVSIYPKVKEGGWIGGDDFSRTIWQHGIEYEPTLVFPFAVYFAEAVGARVYALPYSQFLMQKSTSCTFEFIDLTESYGNISLKEQFLRAGHK